MDVTVSQYRFQYRSLASKMFLTTFAVSIIPLLILGAVARYYFISSYKVEVQQRLKEIILNGQAQLENIIQARIIALRVLAQNPSASFGTKSAVSENFQVLKSIFGDTVQSLVLLDSQGKQVAWSPDTVEDTPSDSSIFPFLQRTNERGLYITDVATDKTRGNSFTIALPVEHDRKKWVLLAAFSTDPLTRVLGGLDLEPAARIFIVNRTGEVQVAFPADAALPEKVAYDERMAGQEDCAVPEINESPEGSTICLKIRITNTPWMLTLFEEKDHAYAAIYDARRSSIAAVFLGALILGLVAAFVSRRLAHHVAHMDQERQLMNEQLMQTAKLASLGEMAAGIAHEINNPLAVMVQEAGWMQDLLDDGTDEIRENIPEFRVALSRIQAHGKRCRGITHKLLSFARPVDHRAEVIQLNSILENVVELYSHRSQGGDLTFTTVLAPDLPKVQVSPSEVEQILVNLINNSLDAMEHGAGSIAITTRLHGHYVVVDVSDNGPGIPKEHLTKVFDPFFTTKPVGKGTGLGLAICYGIMKKLRGDITVTSETGQGTTFHLFFPVV
ncbi:histidine kinase [Desulfomonile tiedjei DSM 6799]|uniref:histidine kinase n=2 Tax=Desulfomonile tiedjei TaxID=2358 RepID=I4C6H7_DESTA|nr:histidine kinase [Desulfomonile tiedjei DSM 6799]